MKKAKAKNKYLLLPLCSLTVVLLLGVTGCGNKKRTQNNSQPEAAAEKKELSLLFNNVSLDQADEQGRPLWKVKATQAQYSQDKKKASVENPKGNLFQDGKLVLQVSAASGEIQEDGRLIFLKGSIVATDPRNKAVVKGDELEWRPKDDLLIVRNNLSGTHPQLVAKANSARYFTRSQQMELQGQIVARSKNPHLQLRTEHLIWQISQQKVIGDRRIQIDRYKGQNITDRVVGDKAEVNLKPQIVTMKQNVQLTSVEPSLDIASDSVYWNLNTERVVSDAPTRILHRQEQITLTANRGEVDLQQQVAVLSGGARGVANRNQAKIAANQLTWNIPTQEIHGKGKVVYQQANPPLTLTGPEGVGKLQDQTVVVTGGSGGRVVTEIIP